MLPGVFYGKGEDYFKRLFEQALEGPCLELYMKGNNMIPMVHV